MMLIPGLVLASMIGVLLVVLWRLRQQLQRIPHSNDVSTAIETARTAIILCVRGADPSLVNCLRGLDRQSHTNYHVHIVADHSTDPAVSVARSFSDKNPLMTIHYLQSDRSRTRGLKVSAILEAFQHIPADAEYIAFIDADVDPHPEWLVQLLAPLQDSTVGITTGTRWFEPSIPGIGSLVRAEWNLYAVALMSRFSIVWGGSFAMRRSLIELLDLPTLWNDKLCEDTCLGDAVRKKGLRTCVVPRVSMINDECCRISGAVAFINRQLVFTRLHSANAVFVLGFCLIHSACCLLSPVMVLAAALIGDVRSLAILAPTAVIFYVAATAFEIAEYRRPFRWKGCVPPKRSVSLLKLHIAQLTCSAVSCWCVIQTLLTKNLNWRGIEYRIGGKPASVEMVEYKPFSGSRQLSADPAVPTVVPAILCEELSI